MPGKTNTIIIIGGNDAGLAAAGRIRRLAPALDVVVIERGPYLAYASCALPYYISGQVPASAVQGMSAVEMLKKRSLRVLTSHTVMEISVKEKTIRVHDEASASDQVLPFHKLVLATGARALMPDELANAANAFTLRSFSDALRLRTFIESERPRNALVVGGGLIGLEVVEALHRIGLNITLIEASSVLAGLPQALAAPLSDHIRSAGVQFHLNTTIGRWQRQGDRITAFQRNDAQELQLVDLVFISTGIRPETELADKAGVRLGAANAIQVNAYQQTNKADLYAVGDCCETVHLVSERKSWLPFAGVAARQGRVAGSNLAGHSARFPGALGTRLVRCFGMELGRTGLNLPEAMANGFTPAETIIHQADKPEYMADHQLISLSVIWDKHSKQLLGGALLGGQG
ncbi:FAD-dependent oxidoreductase, partial [bacterium]|nr:FAD-dependent oxidoreductase [bacterium]